MAALACALAVGTPGWAQQPTDSAARAWQRADVEALLCPGQDPPQIIHHAQGAFSPRAPDRVDFVVVHAPCVDTDPEQKVRPSPVQSQLSWFYAKAGQPVRLSQSNFSRRMEQCVDGAHKGTHRVYCMGRRTPHGARSLHALKFHAWHNVLALTLMEDRPPEQGCPKEVWTADAMVGLEGLKDNELTVRSQAIECVAGPDGSVERVRVELTHQVRLNARHYVVRHQTTNAADRRVERKAHALLRVVSRYNQIPVFRDAQTGAILVRQRRGLPQ